MHVLLGVTVLLLAVTWLRRAAWSRCRPGPRPCRRASAPGRTAPSRCSTSARGDASVRPRRAARRRRPAGPARRRTWSSSRRWRPTSASCSSTSSSTGTGCCGGCSSRSVSRLRGGLLLDRVTSTSSCWSSPASRSVSTWRGARTRPAGPGRGRRGCAALVTVSLSTCMGLPPRGHCPGECPASRSMHRPRDRPVEQRPERASTSSVKLCARRAASHSAAVSSSALVRSLR